MLKYIKKTYMMGIVNYLNNWPETWVNTLKEQYLSNTKLIKNAYSKTEDILKKALKDWNIDNTEEKDILTKLKEDKKALEILVKDQDSIEKITNIKKQELLKDILDWVINKIVKEFTNKEINWDFSIDRYWNVVFNSPEYVWKNAVGYKSILNTEMLTKMWINTNELLNLLNVKLSQEKQIIAENKKIKKQQEKIANIQKWIKSYNEALLNTYKQWIDNLWELPKWIKVGYNEKTWHIEITNNWKVLRYFTPMWKNAKWELVWEENKDKLNPDNFKKWVQRVLINNKIES